MTTPLRARDRQMMVSTAVPVLTAVTAFALPFALLTSPLQVAAVLASLAFIGAAVALPADRARITFTLVAVAVAVVVPLQFVSPSARLVELCVLAACAGVVVARGGRPQARRGVVLLLVGYAAVVSVGTVASDIPGSVTVLFQHFALGAVFVLLGCSLNRADRSKAGLAFVGLAVLESCYAFVEVAVRTRPLWAAAATALDKGAPVRLASELVPGLTRAQGTLGHPLPLAFLLVVAFALALRHPALPRTGRLVVAVVLGAGVVSTGSRSATAIMVVLVLLAPGRARLRAGVRALYMVVVGLLGAYAAGAFDPRTGVFAGIVETGSWTHRFAGLDSVQRLLVLQDTTQVWWGNGWRSVQWAFSRGLLQRDGFTAIDNQWITLLLVAGVVGVVAFAAVLTASVVKAPLAVRPALVSAAGFFFVYDVLLWPSSWAVLALLIGLAGSRRHREEAETTHDVSVSRGQVRA